MYGEKAATLSSETQKESVSTEAQKADCVRRGRNLVVAVCRHHHHFIFWRRIAAFGLKRRTRRKSRLGYVCLTAVFSVFESAFFQD